MSIGINAVIIVVAAFSLILDFNFIEQGVAQEAPQYMEWYWCFWFTGNISMALY